MNQPLAQDAILDGKCQFDAPEKIARQPIGAADEDLRLTGVLKIIDPAVFQKTVHDTAHGNVFAEALETGPKTTNAADNQVNLYTCFGCAIKRLDDLPLGQRIDLGDNPGGQSAAGV